MSLTPSPVRCGGSWLRPRQRQRGIVYSRQGRQFVCSIARKFNVSQEMLMEYNGLSSPEISCGQKLLVPVYQMKYNDKV